jgi:hypothetical protein
MNNATLTPSNALYYQNGPSGNRTHTQTHMSVFAFSICVSTCHCICLYLLGFFNVTSLVNDLPAYISNPQFYGAPASMADRVEVVWKQYDADFYQTYFDIEPIRLVG